MFKLSVKMSAAVDLSSLTCLTMLTLITWVLMRGPREEHDESVQIRISVWDGRVYTCVVRLPNFLTWGTGFTVCSIYSRIT